ncbi:Ig-like domain-containing protein, partial [Sulfitobacter sp.]|uniref:Ig-like domain-containing protein n=1 Tax=Sulfitobacter sp. TaxID=1903071 RepID=UPI003EF676A3
QGTLSAALASGETLNVIRDAVVIGQALVDDSDPANISWTFDDSALEDGSEYSYQVQVVDGSGNQGPLSNEYTITVDITQEAPTIIDVSDNIGDEQGSIAQGGTTDDAMPTITGSGEAGSIITLLDNGEVVGTGIVDGSGNWSIEPELPLLEGSHSFTAISTDAAGNASDPSAARTLVLDIPGPNAPAIDAVIDDQGDVTGVISKGNGITDDTSPTVIGSGQVGATITLYDADANELGTAVVDAQGNWSIEIDPVNGLSEGEQSLTAIATLAGKDSPETGPYTFTVDSMTPVAPIYSVIDDQGNTTGPLADGDTTDDAQPTFSGIDAIPGAVITILDGTEVIASTTVNPDGTWEVTPVEPLADGEHEFDVTQTGPNGITSAGTPITVTVDTRDVLVTITHISDDVEGIVGDVAPNGLTNDAEPVVSGHATAGKDVTVLLNGDVIGTVPTDSQGVWSLPVPATTPLTEGENIFVAQVENASGETVNSTQFSVTLDTTAPDSVTDMTATDDVGSDQGLITNGGNTDDTTPTFDGSGEPGDSIDIYDNGELIGSTVVDPAGAWTFTPSTPLAQGPHSITTQATDPAGNTSDPSVPFTFDLDSSAPEQSAVITNVYDDVNDVGNIASGASTDDTAPQLQGTLSAALASGETLNVIRDAVVIGQALVDDSDPANISWTFDDSALEDGREYSYQVQVVDGSGNQGPLSNEYTIIVDSSPPAQNISIDFITDDVEPQAGDFESGSSTNDVTPLINGSMDQGLAADEYIVVYRDGVELGQAVVDSSDPDNIT